jgi:hypothetical protein
MPELRVPFAVDDKTKKWLVSPETAEKGRNYFCPACQEPVIFKQGEMRVAHFAHKTSDTCNQESITQKTAKLLVQKAVHEWKAGKSNSPALQRACQICGISISQPLPDKVDSAVLEHRLADGSVADVALLVGETVQAAVEIRVTHAVDELKANRLPVPFIELDGYEVIENPAVWKPIIDNFKPLTCDKCKATYLKFQAKVKQVAKASNVELPAAYYRYGFCKCWKCKREIIVFAWPKDGMHDDSAPKVKPCPRTVQYRFSKTVGDKYWVNTCPYCQSIQGDFFLYGEPDGPFFAVNLEEDSPMAFDRDMLRIAEYVVQIGLL